MGLRLFFGRGLLAAAFGLAFGWLGVSEARGENCTVCDKPPGDYLYLIPDKMEPGKKTVCETCAKTLERCYLCGLPAGKGNKELEDGRVLCARDIKLAVLDAEEARQICEELKVSLDRCFSRFINIPDVHSTELIDRINLLALFKVPGNDNTCPNIQGYTKPLEMGESAPPQFHIYLMSGLTAPDLKATLAHEYGHAWFLSNVPEARRRAISKDAHEGFCELLAYLLMADLQEQGAQATIVNNAYTRGQFPLLLQAQQKYGLSDVVDWVKYGVDSKLQAGAVDRVRNVQMPKVAAAGRVGPTVATPVAIPSQPETPPEEALAVKSIFYSTTRPLALINGRSFAPKEAAKIKYGQTNLTVRCLSIRTNSVRVHIAETGETLDLRVGFKGQVKLSAPLSDNVLPEQQSNLPPPVGGL